VKRDTVAVESRKLWGEGDSELLFCVGFFVCKVLGNNVAMRAANATIQWYSGSQERLRRRDNLVAKEISPISSQGGTKKGIKNENRDRR
jgi:hypothetical protein